VANFDLHHFSTPDELAGRVAALWLEKIEWANRAGKNHCVALSGGRITHKLFASAVEQARRRKTSFERVHFFWADERCLLPSDPESNFKLANDSLFKPLAIADGRIHRLRGEEKPEAAAGLASAEILRIAETHNGLPVLDLIFLGMGEDGHVASLFPGKMDGMGAKDVFVAVHGSPKPPADRISLSYAAIALAKEVWVLASGAGKEEALWDSLSGSGNRPFGRVIKSRSGTGVFTDIAVEHL